MAPTKQRALGIDGCRLVPAAAPYPLKDGKATQLVAVTHSLLLAEPCLKRFTEAQPIATEAALDRGYLLVRSYDDALAAGLA
jgi:hypothetical protein